MSKLERVGLARTISEALEESALALAMLTLHGGKESRKRQLALDIFTMAETRKGVLRNDKL